MRIGIYHHLGSPALQHCLATKALFAEAKLNGVELIVVNRQEINWDKGTIVRDRQSQVPDVWIGVGLGPSESAEMARSRFAAGLPFTAPPIDDLPSLDRKLKQVMEEQIEFGEVPDAAKRLQFHAMRGGDGNWAIWPLHGVDEPPIWASSLAKDVIESIDRLNSTILGELTVEIAVYGDKAWFLSAKAGVSPEQQERIWAKHALAFALRLAGQWKAEVSLSGKRPLHERPLIGMLTDERSIEQSFREACAYVALGHDADFYYFLPWGVRERALPVKGYSLRGGVWEVGYFPFPDVLMDRLRRIGKRNFLNTYKALSNIPSTNDRRSGSFDKVELYRMMERNRKLNPHLIPYIKLSDAKNALHFIDKYGTTIVKPTVGSYGNKILIVEPSDGTYLLKEEQQYHQLRREDFVELLDVMSKRSGFVVQKFINSVTNEGLPFHIRVHMVRGQNEQWTILRFTPYISANPDGKVVNHASNFRTFTKWEWFLEHQYGDKAAFMEAKIGAFAMQATAMLDENLDSQIWEAGLDIGIDRNGQLWLYEINMNQMGVIIQGYEFEYARTFVTGVLSLIRPKVELRVGVYRKDDPLRSLPPQRIRALVNEAERQGIELFFFSAADVDIEQRSLLATYRQAGRWEKRKVQFPDIIMNEWPSVPKDRPPVEEQLRKLVPFTTHLIHGKADLVRMLTPRFGRFMLPQAKASSFAETLEFLLEHKDIVLKPDRGRKGENIRRIQIKGEGLYLISEQAGSRQVNEAELNDIVDTLIAERSYHVQLYWPVSNSQGEQVDYRIHVQRDGQAEWRITKVYPRIAQRGSIITNLSQGGETEDIDLFLQRSYPDRSLTQQLDQPHQISRAQWLKQKLEELAIQLASAIDTFYPFLIDELGIDLLMNEAGDIRFLEANAGPETRHHEAERAIKALEYASYIAQAKRNQRKIGQRPVIGMMHLNSRIEDRLREQLAVVAREYDADLICFGPHDLHVHLGLIKGYSLRDGVWKPGYVPLPDVVYDRVKNSNAFPQVYKILQGTPFMEKRQGNWMIDKLTQYDLFSNVLELREHVIPYLSVEETSKAMRFLDNHGAVVIKPTAGSYGKEITLIEGGSDGKFTVKDEKSIQQLNRKQVEVFFHNMVDSPKRHVIQAYRPSVTKAGVPFYIRIHLVKDERGVWRSITPLLYLSVDPEINPINHSETFWSYSPLDRYLRHEFEEQQRRVLRENIEKVVKTMVQALEQQLGIGLCEAGVDIGIGPAGEINIFEVNTIQIGVDYKEYEIAKILIPAALSHVTRRSSGN